MLWQAGLKPCVIISETLPAKTGAGGNPESTLDGQAIQQQGHFPLCEDTELQVPCTDHSWDMGTNGLPQAA